MRSHLIILICATLSGCTSSSNAGVDSLFDNIVSDMNNNGHPIKANYPKSNLVTSNGEGAGSVSGAYYHGTGTYVGAPVIDITPGTTSSNSPGYTLNLMDAPIKAAAQNVMGDILKVNYTVDPRVQGTVSMQTTNPVDRETLIELFESSLSVSGAAIIKKGDLFQIVPSSEATTMSPPVSAATAANAGPGVRVQVIELKYIAADEMRTILEPISKPGSIIRSDNKRNQILVSGNATDIKAISDAVSVFDVDWMRGRSVALEPLHNVKPSGVVKQLEAIFGVGNGKGDVIQFVANEQLNSVLVISARPAYVARASKWIRKLDQSMPTSEQQLFVYQVQNRPVKELASVLQAVLGSKNPNDAGAPSQPDETVAPDLTKAALTTGGLPESPDKTTVDMTPVDYTPKKEVPSVVPDLENNSLLISTSGAEYKRIESILNQLDVLPTQVMIEAVIAEVRLNDELKFGLRWAVESGKFRFNLSDVASGSAAASLPGAAWSFVSSDLQVTLNALSSVTDVNIVSSPNILALNGQKANLQVGDQVPIVTQQSAGVQTINAPVVNSITLKDTGVILSVLPRINSAGRVMLDIDQEVSNVVKTTTSGIDSPTIQQRKLTTKVVVNDGESIALGGLIQERNNLDRGQVPILGDIPILGNIFKNKTDSITRTELIIFIRPHVVRNINEARLVTEEFRNKLSFNTALSKRREGRTTLERDLNRLKY